MRPSMLASVSLHGALTAGLWGLALALVLFVVSNLALVAVVVLLPADFFRHSPLDRTVAGRHWGVYLALMTVKNVVGFVLALLGAVLILPGVPGPGLVLILIGLAMLDFPGKRRLERKLVSYRGVLRAINRLRVRFGRPPLELDVMPPGHPTHNAGP